MKSGHQEGTDPANADIALAIPLLQTNFPDRQEAIQSMSAIAIIINHKNDN